MILDTQTATFDGYPVLSGSLTLDEQWSPSRQASVTLSRNSHLDAIDPREGNGGNLVVTQTSVDPAAATVTRNLGMVHRSRSRNADGTIAIGLGSFEAVLNDYGQNADHAVVGDSMLSVVIEWVLSEIYGDSTLLVEVGTDYDLSAFQQIDTDGTPIGLWWKVGITATQFLTPYLQTAHARLWADDSGGFHLTAEPTNTGGSIAITAAGTMTDYTEDIDRTGDWYNNVVVVTNFQWPDGFGITRDVSSLASRPSNRRTYYEERDGGLIPTYTYPPSGAAAYIVNRMASLGRALSVKAVSDYRIDLGMPITVTFEDGSTASGRVSAVTFDFGSAEMTVRIRDLA